MAGIQHQPVPTFSYDVSKAAVHALTKKLATELAPRITVNAIAPGARATATPVVANPSGSFQRREQAVHTAIRVHTL